MQLVKFIPEIIDTLTVFDNTRQSNLSIQVARPAVAEKPRDASCLSVALIQFVERNLLLLVSCASDLPLAINKICCVLFSSS